MAQAALDAAARTAVRASGESYRRRRLVGVTHRVVFGTRSAIEQVLAKCGWAINTAFVERLNLDIRQRVAAVGRRVNTLCQGEDGLLDQLVLFQTYHNFVLPHASLRQALPMPEPTPNTGAAKVWRVHPGHGGGIDRPCLVAQRGVVLPRAAVAPGTDGLTQDTG